MPPFGSSRYANVTSTLALVLALGGTGYAATSLPHHAAASAKAPKLTDKTKPIAVFNIGPGGHIVRQTHRAPITGKPKSAGNKSFKGVYTVSFPGFNYDVAKDTAVCSVDEYRPYTAVVDAGGARNLVISVFNEKDAPANAALKCAVWALG